MDKNTIIQSIIGFLLVGLGSAIGWLFSSISDLKHNQDILKVQVEQNDKELLDLWSKYNKEQEVKFEELKEFYNFKVEYYKNKNHD